jgi:putative transcriptional regulator
MTLLNLIQRLFRQTPDRCRHIILFIVLSVVGWPALLQAEQPEQVSHEQASSSFLLVATQQMRDPRFRRTVILVTSHGHTGPIGVIVNRPLDITLDQLFPDYPLAKGFSLYYGGPAYPKQISYLVRGGEAVTGALKIDSDIYLAYDPPALEELLSGKRQYKDLRVMHGLASWAPGQLEYEIKLGGWLVLPFDETIIFDHPPAGMWQELSSHSAVL